MSVQMPGAKFQGSEKVGNLSVGWQRGCEGISRGVKGSTLVKVWQE